MVMDRELGVWTEIPRSLCFGGGVLRRLFVLVFVVGVAVLHDCGLGSN